MIDNAPHRAMRRHISGKVLSGESEAIVERPSDPTTRRAEEIREETGMSWETSCELAELERDGGTMPVPVAEIVRTHNTRQDTLGSCYVGTPNVGWPA